MTYLAQHILKDRKFKIAKLYPELSRSYQKSYVLLSSIIKGDPKSNQKILEITLWHPAASIVITEPLISRIFSSFWIVLNSCPLFLHFNCPKIRLFSAAKALTIWVGSCESPPELHIVLQSTAITPPNNRATV